MDAADGWFDLSKGALSHIVHFEGPIMIQSSDGETATLAIESLVIGDDETIVSGSLAPSPVDMWADALSRVPVVVKGRLRLRNGAASDKRVRVIAIGIGGRAGG